MNESMVYAVRITPPRVSGGKIVSAKWAIIKRDQYIYESSKETSKQGIISHMIDVANNEKRVLDPKGYKKNKKGEIVRINLYKEEELCNL